MNPFDSKLKRRNDQDMRLLQARMTKSLYDKLRIKLRKENVTIQAFMEAAAIIYLEK